MLVKKYIYIIVGIMLISNASICAAAAATQDAQGWSSWWNKFPSYGDVTSTIDYYLPKTWHKAAAGALILGGAYGAFCGYRWLCSPKGSLAELQTVTQSITNKNSAFTISDTVRQQMLEQTGYDPIQEAQGLLLAVAHKDKDAVYRILEADARLNVNNILIEANVPKEFSGILDRGYFLNTAATIPPLGLAVYLYIFGNNTEQERNDLYTIMSDLLGFQQQGIGADAFKITYAMGEAVSPDNRSRTVAEWVVHMAQKGQGDQRLLENVAELLLRYNPIQ